MDDETLSLTTLCLLSLPKMLFYNERFIFIYLCNVIKQHTLNRYAECHHAECCYAECGCAEYHNGNAVTQRVVVLNVITLNGVMLSVFVLSVMAPRRQLRLIAFAFLRKCSRKRKRNRNYF
jgi:hypothetical protein